MSDRTRTFHNTAPFLDADERKERLVAARRLLDSNNIDDIRRAMNALPDTGSKARLLRDQLTARCQVLERRANLPSAAPVPVSRVSTPEHPANTRPRPLGPTVQVGEGHRLVFHEFYGDSPDLCSVRVIGGLIEVHINRTHPAMEILYNNHAGRLHDVAVLLLSAWVTLEIEAGSDRRREHIQDMRVDWSRVLTRLSRKSM